MSQVFLPARSEAASVDSAVNSPRPRIRLPRRHATACRDRRTGRRSVAKAQSQRGERESLVVRLRSRPPSGRRSRRRGYSSAKPGVQPGGDGVAQRRHCPRAHAQLSDQTTRPLCPRTVAAARSSSVQPGRRVPPRATSATQGGLFGMKYRRADLLLQLPRRCEAKLRLGSCEL